MSGSTQCLSSIRFYCIATIDDLTLECLTEENSAKNRITTNRELLKMQKIRCSLFSTIYLRCFEAACNVHSVLGVDELVLMRRHKSLERMAHEHELEVRAKNALFGRGRQPVKQVHITVDSSGMNVDVGRSAVDL